MKNIIKFPKQFDPKPTIEEIPVRKILAEADKKDLDEVMVIGFDKNGEIYVASSRADSYKCLWLLENAKNLLLNCSELIQVDDEE
jgi:hypothetical protein